MPEHRMVARFSGTEIIEGVVSGNVTSRINEPSTAEVVISEAALIDANTDYQSEVQVFAGTDDDLHLLFTGFVVSVEPRGGETHI